MRHSTVRATASVNRLETSRRRADSVNGRNRNGGVVILFVLLLPVLLAMVAFAVDVGRVTMLRSELQNVVDSGTLAAQIQLRAQPGAVGPAEKVAREYVRRNMIGSRLVPEGSIDVEVGYWDSEKSTFDSSNPNKNAVRVFARQDDQPYIFGRTMGYQTFGVPASAIATGATSTLDIMLTLDLSGSMLYQGRIQALRASAPVFVEVIDELGNSDQIGVMGLSADPSNFDLERVGPDATLYNSGLHAAPNYHVGVMENPLTPDLPSVTSATLSNANLRASKYHGATGTGAALGDSVHYLINGAEARSHAGKIVVLMTDGHANRPPGNGPGYAREMATYAANSGVTVYTISLGNAADEDLNQDIADMTGGKHFLARGQDVSVLTQSLTDAFRDIVDDIKRTHLVK